MPVSGFQIENVKGLELAECDDVPQLMVIVGPNGVGKSTLLNTIYEYDQTDDMGRGTNISGDVDVDYVFGNTRVYFSPNRVPQSRDIQRSQLVGSETNSYLEMLSDESIDIQGLGTRRNTLEGADTKPYGAVKRRLAELRELRLELLDSEYTPEDGVDSGTAPEITDILQDALSDVLPGLTFTGVERREGGGRNSQSTVELTFRNRTGDQVTFSDLSSGEKDIVSMLFLLVEPEMQQQYVEAGIEDATDRSLTVLIDSPEMHLHPDLEKRFIRYIQDYMETHDYDQNSTSFIIATHSKILIDAIDEENLYYLLYPSEARENQLEPATDIDVEPLERITSELGLAALSSGRHLLCVEGRTDEEILSHIYPELVKDFTLLDMGGSEQVRRIDDSLSSIVDELVSSGREIFAIVDRDRSLSLSDDVSNRVYVLSATCIENVLLSPEAIHSIAQTLFSRQERESMGIQSSDDVESLIHDIISDEEFKRKEAWTRFNESFNPINIDRQEYYFMKEEGIVNDFDDYLSNRIQEHRESVEDIEQIEEEIDILVENNEWQRLDGKRILKELSNRFNEEHRRLARMIAREMNLMADDDSTDYERPSDLTAFLTEIQSSVS